jgi:hypothetical protein
MPEPVLQCFEAHPHGAHLWRPPWLDGSRRCHGKRNAEPLRTEQCSDTEPHPAHLIPGSAMYRARWCPGVAWYFRAGKPRRFECMAQPDLGRPLNHA